MLIMYVLNDYRIDIKSLEPQAEPIRYNRFLLVHQAALGVASQLAANSGATVAAHSRSWGFSNRFGRHLAPALFGPKQPEDPEAVPDIDLQMRQVFHGMASIDP